MPTPALAAAALGARVPALMVTGSHIPEDQNGIKFYRPDGELLKDDEAPIRTGRHCRLASRRRAPVETNAADPPTWSRRPMPALRRQAFGTHALSGLRLGVYEHSAAGRDLVAAILCGLGAELTASADPSVSSPSIPRRSIRRRVALMAERDRSPGKP